MTTATRTKLEAREYWARIMRGSIYSATPGSRHFKWILARLVRDEMLGRRNCIMHASWQWGQRQLKLQPPCTLCGTKDWQRYLSPNNAHPVCEALNKRGRATPPVRNEARPCLCAMCSPGNKNAAIYGTTMWRMS